MKTKLLGWGVLTVLVVVAARTVAWGDVAHAVAGAHPLWLAAAVAANGAILLLATGQWLLFLPGSARVSPRRMFSIVAITSTVSNGGPPLAGHATGIHLLATRGGLGHAGGVSLTLLDQVAEGLAKWALLAVAAAVVPGFTSRGLGVAVIVGVPALAAAALLLAHRGHHLERLEARVRGWGARVLRFVVQGVHHLEALRRPRRFLAGVGLALLQKVAEGAAIAAVAAALGLALPPWVVVAALVAVNLTTLVSVTPANLGLYEGAAFLVYRAGGLDAETAAALAVVQHALYLLPLAGTGWAILTLQAAGARRRPARSTEVDGEG